MDHDPIAVLHVDDEPDHLKLTRQFLKKIDHSLEVESTSSPGEALKKLGERRFDCVVSDYAMPGMNGVELARKVRETNDIPFVLYTGKGSEEIAEAAFAVGIDDYIKKEIGVSHYIVLARRIVQAVGKYRAVASLRESEERYRNFLETSPDAATVIFNERYAYVNKKQAQLLGFDDPSDLIGRGAIDFVAPEDRERVLAIIRGRARGEEHPTLYELKLMRKDGTRVDVETHVSVIKYDGEPASLAFSREIAERIEYRQRLEALHRHSVDLSSLEKMEDVIEATLRVMKLVFDFEFFSFLLVRGNDLVPIGSIGAPLLNFALPLDGIGITVKACRTRSSILVNDVRVDPSFFKGNTDSLSELAVPVLINTECVAVLNVESTRLNSFTVQDQRLMEIFASHVGSAITRLRQLDTIRESEERYREISVELERNLRELRSYSEHLNRLVEEKTQELLDAERIATAGRVAALVGHDLRSPLQAIKAATYLLKHSPGDGEAFEIIDRSVNRAIEMLEEFRNLTRDSPLQVETVDLGSLLKQIIRESNPPPSIDVKLELGSGLDSISLDQSKMRRVFENMLSNSMRAMPDDGTLTIRARKSKHNLIVEVSDTGVGIPDEFKPKLFKSFQTMNPDGLGLGLLYCKRAVEAHGGAITFVSEVGVGTTFTIALPMDRLGKESRRVDTHDYPVTQVQTQE